MLTKKPLSHNITKFQPPIQELEISKYNALLYKEFENKFKIYIKQSCNFSRIPENIKPVKPANLETGTNAAIQDDGLTWHLLGENRRSVPMASSIISNYLFGFKEFYEEFEIPLPRSLPFIRSKEVKELTKEFNYDDPIIKRFHQDATKLKTLYFNSTNINHVNYNNGIFYALSYSDIKKLIYKGFKSIIENHYIHSLDGTAREKYYKIINQYINKCTISTVSLKNSDILLRVSIGNRSFTELVPIKAQTYKPGKLLTSLFDIVKPHQSEYLTNICKTFENQKKEKLKEFNIITGNLISYYYNGIRYTKENTGSLHSSCVRSAESVNFYSLFKDSVSMLVKFDSKGKLKGRALLWKCIPKTYWNSFEKGEITAEELKDKEVQVLDRIYYDSQETANLFVGYARTNGIKTSYSGSPNQGIDRAEYFVILPKNVDKLKLDYLVNSISKTPYMDSFSSIKEIGEKDKRICLTNFNSRGFSSFSDSLVKYYNANNKTGIADNIIKDFLVANNLIRSNSDFNKVHSYLSRHNNNKRVFGIKDSRNACFKRTIENAISTDSLNQYTKSGMYEIVHNSIKDTDFKNVKIPIESHILNLNLEETLKVFSNIKNSKDEEALEIELKRLIDKITQSLKTSLKDKELYLKAELMPNMLNLKNYLDEFDIVYLLKSTNFLIRSIVDMGYQINLYLLEETLKLSENKESNTAYLYTINSIFEYVIALMLIDGNFQNNSDRDLKLLELKKFQFLFEDTKIIGIRNSENKKEDSPEISVDVKFNNTIGQEKSLSEFQKFLSDNYGSEINLTSSKNIRNITSIFNACYRGLNVNTYPGSEIYSHIKTFSRQYGVNLKNFYVRTFVRPNGSIKQHLEYKIGENFINHVYQLPLNHSIVFDESSMEDTFKIFKALNKFLND